jgi:thioredoxin reductase (NADPH)
VKPRLIVVGAGPAGASAALWARDRFEVTVLERAAQPGGQLAAIHFAPTQLPGRVVRDGAELIAIIRRQLEAPGITVRYGVTAEALEPGSHPAVRAAGGERFKGDALIVTSGLTRRRLGIPGERELDGRGVSTSATLDRERFAGRPVLVVGGGDAAFENALLLAAVGCDVTIAVRGEPRASARFQRAAAASPLIHVWPDTRVTAFVGSARLEGALLEQPLGTRELTIGGAVIKVGAVPNTSWCSAVLATDDQFVRADARGRTSLRGVWAAGDVTHPALFAISVAEAAAALAVTDLARAVTDAGGA